MLATSASLSACADAEKHSRGLTDTGPRDADELVPPDTAGDVGEDLASLDGPRDTSVDVNPADSGPPEVGDMAEDDADAEADTSDAGDGLPPYPEASVDGWVYSVDDLFWANMDDFVFGVLPGQGVDLYLTVFNANHFGIEAYRALGQEIVRRPEAFLRNALVPLLERYGDSGVIWAIDCMNEPEAMVAGPDGNREAWGVTWDEMRSFLAACADTVHLYSLLPVSAGSGWHDWDNVVAGRYDGLGFDFLDFHTYADAFDIPTVAELGVDLPVVIGECGQVSTDRDDGLQLSALRQCFAQAEAGDYAAALSWQYDYPGSPNQHAHIEADGSWRPVAAAFDEFADSPMEAGINLAWFSGGYGHDMATDTFHPTWSVVYDHDVAAGVIADLQARDIELLRFWVLEGGEALYYYALFEDFERGLDRWQPVGGGVTPRTSALNVGDGTTSLAVHLSPDTPGWHGVAARWDEATPLNLELATEWQLELTNASDRALGVNLAFLTAGSDSPLMFQTTSGPLGGQAWLEPGERRIHTVSLGEADFAAQWALDSAPTEGVARPAQVELRNVQEIQVRVHFSDDQLPFAGELFVDAMRIR